MRLINQVCLYTIFLASLAAPFILWTYGTFALFGLLAGCVWSVGNFYLIRYLLFNYLKTGSRNYLLMTLLLALKFPVLYATGYFLLSIPNWPPLSLVMGLILSLFVLMGVGLSESRRVDLGEKRYG